MAENGRIKAIKTCANCESYFLALGADFEDEFLMDEFHLFSCPERGRKIMVMATHKVITTGGGDGFFVVDISPSA